MGQQSTGDLIPEEIRADWEGYVDRTVRDVWGRPALAPTDRSIVTIAALAVLRCPTELEIHARNALRKGVPRLVLCEAMLQVAGYAGVGIGVEGLRSLRTVFDEEPDLGADPGDLPKGLTGTRLERAREIQTYLTEQGERDAARWIDAELARPLDPHVLAREVTDMELATEVYLASLLAIEVDHFMERGYLDELARALKLDDNLKGSIERQVAQLNGPG